MHQLMHTFDQMRGCKELKYDKKVRCESAHKLLDTFTKRQLWFSNDYSAKAFLLIHPEEYF